MHRFVLIGTFIKVQMFLDFILILIKTLVKVMFWRPCRCSKRQLIVPQREYITTQYQRVLSTTIHYNTNQIHLTTSLHPLRNITAPTLIESQIPK
jgi:hypothetical protein